MFYQLGLNLWQFILGATDFRIDFRKLVCEDNNSGYESTCANEGIVDEKRLPRKRKLVHELKRKGTELLDLGWRPSVDLGHAWVMRHSSGLAGPVLAGRGRRERERKERKREREGRKKREKRKERERKERGRRWKVWGFRVLKFEFIAFLVFQKKFCFSSF